MDEDSTHRDQAKRWISFPAWQSPAGNRAGNRGGPLHPYLALRDQLSRGLEKRVEDREQLVLGEVVPQAPLVEAAPDQDAGELGW
jgi:hypothetical protein